MRCADRARQIGGGASIRTRSPNGSGNAIHVIGADSVRALPPLAQKMNEMAQKYYETSRPAYQSAAPLARMF